MGNTLFRLRHLSLVTWSLFFSYILLLVFFNVIDVYHHHFFSTGLIVVLYNLARLVFIVYLMWLFYIVGDWILTIVVGDGYRSLMTMESALLAFFAGFGVWHIVLLMVGFAGLYHRYLMVAVTLIIFAASLPRLNQWIQQTKGKRSTIYWPGLLLLILPVLAFLVTKGLYPAGGHDYYNHYFPFYRKVVDSGSILPNEVWYHFYYSKGAALFFLSMLLTDPLAPQLATTSMILAGAAMVFSILNRKSSWRLLPWIGASLYLAFLIYTPGPPENMHQGGWADLEKLHEPIAVLMLATIWITIRLVDAQQSKPWGVSLLLVVSALVLITTWSAVIVGSYFMIASLYYLLSRNKNAFWLALGGIFVAGTWLIISLVINYFLTGLPTDQSLHLFWPITNLDKIRDWGVLPEFMIHFFGVKGMVANQVSFNADFIPKIMGYLRLDVWGLLLYLTIGLFGIIFFLKKREISKNLDKISLLFCVGFLFLIMVLSCVIGRSQPISFYRFTSFSYAPMLCVCMLLLSAAFNCYPKKITKVLMSLLIVFAMSKFTLTNHHYKDNAEVIIKQGEKFLTGQFSIADAYKNQQGWPGRMPWGGIYPAAEAVWKQLPPKTRIWSMHIHGYCMLPDCHMEQFMSFRLSHYEQSILFGSPKQAKEYLKKEQLNYFFFSTALTLTDPLPLSLLFSPEHIADYLGIEWTDGQSTLLTWKEQARFPIDSVWLNHYHDRVNSSASIKNFPYNLLHQALDHLPAKVG